MLNSTAQHPEDRHPEYKSKLNSYLFTNGATRAYYSPERTIESAKYFDFFPFSQPDCFFLFSRCLSKAFLNV
jgi:hypothetical protein